MSALEFIGNDVNEAVQNACTALNIKEDELKYEIIETKKKSIFSKGAVKISVHVEDEINEEVKEAVKADVTVTENINGEEKIIKFVTQLIDKMGMSGKVTVNFKEDTKIGISIESADSGLLIGRRGKTLDAIQLIANAVSGRINEHNKLKVIVDTENYRTKKQEKIISIAERVADQVRRSRGSRLLEPMNPFERRIIHTALNNVDDIETISEGDGLYKQIRICYKGK
ncbi:MAG: protein jag [Spirochaetales bacterium]|nr:protein jag [Spirochaetales bacterium]